MRPLAYTDIEHTSDHTEVRMQLDRNAIKTLLSLDDARLKFVIDRMAESVGIDLDSFGLRNVNVGEIRQKLSSLTDEELQRAADQINGNSRR